MKKIIPFLILLFVTTTVFSQNITGKWSGILKVQGSQLRIVLNIDENEEGFISTMDSPDQKVNGIPVTKTIFEDSILEFEINDLKVKYEGKYWGDSIVGVFEQGAMRFPLSLLKKEIEKQVFKRPQEPKSPYPYYSEDVIFKNEKANITLAGTLTLPSQKGYFPVVILISGSGAQDRNEEIYHHKPFLVISDYLTRNGIAVLRYDDRGTAKSEGNFSTSTTEDFASDVESAIAYLKTRTEIDKTKIGLIGHSEGGIIAPMVAAKSKDVSFIVLLAGSGIRGDKLLLLQQELIARKSGIADTVIEKVKKINTGAFKIISESTNDKTLKSDLTNYLKPIVKSMAEEEKLYTDDEELVSMQINTLLNVWMLYFIKYDPIFVLEKVKCPVLAVNGEKDLQVPPKENLSAIENALKKGGNKQVTTMEFPNLNHLFQECNTGLPAEYESIEQTFSPLVLNTITKWILQLTTHSGKLKDRN